MDTKKKPLVHLAVVGLYAFITAILFRKVFSSEMIFGSDIVLEFFYNRAYGFGELLKGQIPLWNPHRFCGYPFVTAIQTAIFYPLNLIFLIFTTETAFTAIVFIHVVLSGCAMYCYIQHLTKNDISSFISGLVYMMSGFIMGHIYAGHVPMQCAYAWIPLIILSLDKAASDNSPRWTLLGGLFFGCQILAGYPMFTLYTGLLVAVYSIRWAWMRYREKGICTEILSVLVPGIAIGILGALLSAVQLIPTYVFSHYSVRSQAMTYEFATSYSLPPENFITFIVPYFFGDMATVRYWGRWFLWDVLPYAGIFPLCLLLVGAASRKRMCSFMAILGVGSALIAFGRYAGYYKLLYYVVPGFSLFRGPARILVLYAFACAAASGLVTADFIKDPKRYKTLFSRAWKVLLAVTLLLVVVLAASREGEGGNSLSWKIIIGKSLSLGDRDDLHPSVGTRPFLESSYAFARKNLWLGCLWLLLSAGAALIASGKHRKLFPAIAALIILADLLWASGRYVKGVEHHKGKLEPEIVKALKSKQTVAPVRIATSRDVQDLSRPSLSGISHAGGWDAAQLRRYSEYANVLAGRDPNEDIIISEPIRPGRLLRLTGISHVLTAPQKPHYPGSVKVLDTPTGNLYEIRNPHPRAFLVHKVRVIPDKKKRLEELPRIDSLQEAIIERPLGIAVAPTPVGAAEHVTILNYSAHRVELEVSAATAGVLVLTDAYYPAWKAETDGVKARVFPVDHLFRGIEIAPGKHRVVFTYDRSAYTAGKTLSLGSFFVIVLLLVAGSVVGKTEPKKKRPSK